MSARAGRPAAVCALLLTLASAAAAEPVALTVTASVAGWDGAHLSQEITRLLRDALAADYGGWVTLAPEGASATRLPVTVSVQGTPGALTVRSVLATSGGPGRSVTSHASSVALLVPVIAGDMLSLWAGDRPQGNLSLTEPGPLHVASVRTASLAPLLGRGAAGEVADIAYGPDGLVLAFPEGPIALDPLLRVTSRTARDLLLLGRAPLEAPLARLQAPLTGLRVMLLADQSTLLVSDTASGETIRTTLPGGPVAGIAAMPWGGFAAWRQAPSGPTGPTAEILVGQTRGAQVVTSSFVVAPALVTAIAADYDGNVWLFDAVERRIRIFDRSGRETHAVRPLVDRSAFALPQQLAVYPDGSFLFAGAGEVWKLDRFGLPLWRIDGIDRIDEADGRQTRTRRALPRSFRFALHGTRGSFSLLDQESQEIHLFSERLGTGSADPEAALAEALRVSGSIEDTASWCLDNDLTALAQDILGSPRPEEPHATALLRRRLARLAEGALARATAEHAGSLEASLRLEAAQSAYAAAIARYQSLRASFPAEGAYAATILALTRRRLEVRETLLGFLDANVRMRVPVLHGLLSRKESGGAGVLALRLDLPGASGMQGVVAEVASSRAVPGSVTPLGDLVAGREVRIPLTLDADAGLVQEDLPVVIGLRLSGTSGDEVVTSLQSLTTVLSRREIFDPGWYLDEGARSLSPSRADYLAWLAASQDPAMDFMRRTLTEASGSPLEELALVSGFLGDAFQVNESTGDGETLPPRQAAGALAGSGEDALLLAAALTRGVDRAFLTVGGATYLVVDSGAALTATAARDPVLAALSRLAGRATVLVPVAPPRASPAASPLTDAIRRALEEIPPEALARAGLTWVESGGAPVRSFFLPSYPVPAPGLAARAARDTHAARALLGL